MEREAGISVAEKQRLRDAIRDQVQSYLERGGRITVLQPPESASARVAPGGAWSVRVGEGGDPMAQLD